MNNNPCNIPFIFIQLVFTCCIYYLPVYIKLNLHLLKGLVRTLQMFAYCAIQPIAGATKFVKYGQYWCKTEKET